MIQVLKLSSNLYKQFYSDKYNEFIIGLDKFNIFIGKNNSGKSRFIRFIFENKDIEAFEIKDYIDDFKARAHSQLIKQLEYIEGFNSANNIQLKHSQLIDYKNRLNNFQNNDYSLWFELYKFSSLNIEDLYPNSTNLSAEQKSAPKTYLGNINSKILETFSSKNLAKNKTYTRIYLPILRGLRPFQKSHVNIENENKYEDIYLKRTINDYFKAEKTPLKIYTGLGIYEEIKKLILGNENQRKDIFEFEDLLKKYIFNEKVTLIPKYEDDVLHIQIGLKKQFAIYNLGDGMQTIIIILFSLYINRLTENLVFIEEPETHLHNSLQLLLVNALKHFDKNQYFIATHSNVFINDKESAIYNIKSIGTQSEIIKADLQKDKLSILIDLGYNQSDLLISNYVLWVEGQSDKIYLNYWINKQAPELIEGYHYTILTIGGSGHHNFIDENQEFNIEFLSSINQNFGIIMDSDKQDKNSSISKNKQSIKEYFETSGYYVWITSFREIENYIPIEIYKNAIQNIHFDKTNFEVKTGEYDDRGKITDLSAPLHYKSTITLQNDIYSKVQKHGVEAIKDVPARDLKKAIMNSLKKTESRLFTIDKIKVANEVVQIGMTIEEPELKSQLENLIKVIRKANNLS